MKDLAGRLKNKIQLTTDGHKMYLEAVEDAFGSEIDFSQLVKIYGINPDSEIRYSPAECIGTEIKKVQGMSIKPQNRELLKNKLILSAHMCAILSHTKSGK